MSKIILYSNGCPRCAVLKSALDNLGVDYEVNGDMERVRELGFTTIPVLAVDGETMTFNKAMKWCNTAKHGSETEEGCASCVIE